MLLEEIKRRYAERMEFLNQCAKEFNKAPTDRLAAMICTLEEEVRWLNELIGRIK